MLSGSSFGLTIGADAYPAIRKAAENGCEASIRYAASSRLFPLALQVDNV